MQQNRLLTRLLLAEFGVRTFGYTSFVVDPPMEVYSGAPVEGRQPVRELGGGK
jgi:hypothetical protein